MRGEGGVEDLRNILSFCFAFWLKPTLVSVATHLSLVQLPRLIAISIDASSVCVAIGVEVGKTSA